MFDVKLMFNDPSGEFWQFLAIPVVKAVLFAVVSYAATVLITGAKFNILNLYSTIVMTMVSAGITNVIGDVFSAATASIGNEALRSLVHAGVQGTLSFMQGGNFFTAAASAFLASFASFGYFKTGGSDANSGAGQVAFSMLSGGVGSVLTGGNFWDGVKIGGIVALFNHVAHMEDGPGNDERKPIRSKRIRSTSEKHSANGSRGGQTAVIPQIGEGPKAGQGPGIFVPSGSQSGVTADMVFYDDGTADVNMTTQASRMNTRGSYIANYEL